MLSEFSSSSVRFCSTSWALAPDQVVITVTTGASISGNRSTGSLVKENTPRTITTRKIIAVVTGRLTASSYNFIHSTLYILADSAGTTIPDPGRSSRDGLHLSGLYRVTGRPVSEFLPEAARFLRLPPALLPEDPRAPGTSLHGALQEKPGGAPR